VIRRGKCTRHTSGSAAQHLGVRGRRACGRAGGGRARLLSILRGRRAGEPGRGAAPGRPCFPRSRAAPAGRHDAALGRPPGPPGPSCYAGRQATPPRDNSHINPNQVSLGYRKANPVSPWSSLGYMYCSCACISRTLSHHVWLALVILRLIHC